jgi:hypothetical protein
MGPLFSKAGLDIFNPPSFEVSCAFTKGTRKTERNNRRMVIRRLIFSPSISKSLFNLVNGG